MSGASPAIVFDAITVSYGGRPVIEGLSLAVERGLTTGVIGPNGCGKSTLLKTAAGLLKPEGGSVLVERADVHRLPASRRARAVAFMPQDTAATPMSVEELVACGRYTYRGLFQTADPEDEGIVDKALSAAGLDELRRRPVRSLSGGQRQRAYIAMALAQQASCMLLDEPTSALDIYASHEMMELICSVQSVPDQTKLVVLHDIDLALRYCDRIVLMDGGEVVQAGTPDEVVEGSLLQQTFGIEVFGHDTQRGRSWSFFPRA